MPTLEELRASFPYQQYPSILANQDQALGFVADKTGTVILELPTGSGKTAVGYTVLKTLAEQGQGPLFYIVPTKTLVDQVRLLHPDTTEVYGRNEYDCLYYPEEQLKADEIPCLLLVNCPHRVDQQTGETFVPGSSVCPYYWAKFQAKQSPIVVCTMAFYLFTQLFSKEWDEPAGLVIDEAHRLPQVIRNALSFDITDYHLSRAVKLLESINAPETQLLETFLRTMIRIIRSRPPHREVLLDDGEIRQLLDILEQIDASSMRRRLEEAIRSGQIDTSEYREVLTKLERIIHDLFRYIRALEFSLPSQRRNPLNYTYAYFNRELEGQGKVQHRLVVKAYYVVPLIRKILSSRLTLAYSATIGDPEVFGFESGITGPFRSFTSDFPVANTRVFMPTDTPNLAQRVKSNREPTRTIRRLAQACKRLGDEGIRSLVVVVSEVEREKFLRMCAEEGVEVISYGASITAKEAAALFKEGRGTVLAGTSAQYGEGIDLPGQIAPVIFVLRPAYPSPSDPETMFEDRRFGGQKWALWNWRAMISTLQVRGRNVRSAQDLGVTILLSQQFRRFAFSALPGWLKPAYRGDKTFDECIEETLEVLRS